MTINGSYLITKTAGCPAFGDWAIKNKLIVKWGSAKKGDIVLFDFNHNGTSDHIGIVTSANSSYIETVEGNTGNGSNTNGDGVYRRTRYKKDVNYFVRPKYDSKVTADMIVSTALAEVGYKEGRNNNNKYGKWFGVNNAPWCCIFVCWCFAHVKGAEKPITKPTGKYSGTIPSPTLKKGSKGDGVKNLQRFLNWYNPAWKLAVDGDFGSGTANAVVGFQRTEGITADGIYGKNSYTKASAYKASTPKATTPKVHYFGHCANRKLDCVRIQFKYSSKSGDAKHWTYVAVWKDPAKAEKAAQFVEQCIARNPRIQYDDKPNLKKKLIANKGKMPSGALTANCSNLMAAAIYYASGKEIADKGAKNQKAQLKNSGLFNIYTDSRRKGYVQRGAIYGCDKHTGMSLGKK